MENMIWDTTNLKALCDKVNLSFYELAKVVNIPSSTLFNSIVHNVPPTLKTAVRLADYFVVPVDFIIGRCSEKDAAKLLNDYSMAEFRKRERIDFEYARLANKPRPLKVGEPWPYNLVAAINYDDDYLPVPVDYVLTREHTKPLGLALASLKPRSREILLLKYREDKTLDEIAEKLSISKVRIRQIIFRELRSIRCSGFYSSIILGLTTVKRIDELEYRERMLKIKAHELEKLERKLNTRTASLNIPTPNKDSSVEDISDSIRELELSIRARHCLHHGGYKTINDVIVAIKSGEIFNVKGLGTKTALEIASKIESTYMLDDLVSRVTDLKKAD